MFISKRKPFDAELHKSYDLMAKKAVLCHLVENCGLDQSYINPDKYGPDLVSVRNDKMVAYCEVEVKLGWGDTPFPFSTLHIPARKIRPRRSLHGSMVRVVYFVLNSDLTRMVVFEPTLSDPLDMQEVPNKLMPHGEYFAIVPLCRLKEVRLEAEK